MPEPIQSYANHRRFYPPHHFFVMPILIANVGIQIARVFDEPSFDNGWSVILALALAVGLMGARAMALTSQNRVIRLEEQTRLSRILPEDLRARARDLRTGQLIALRFAPDAEVPDLVRRCLAGELETSSAIKRAVRDWRPDLLRV